MVISVTMEYRSIGVVLNNKKLGYGFEENAHIKMNDFTKKCLYINKDTGCYNFSGPSMAINVMCFS